jgi:sec-independent protein translocase protein TatB
MFGLSFTEVVIIAVLALILLGPDQLPSAAKTVGKTLRELRRAADDLKDQISTEMDLGDVSRLGDQLNDQLSRLGEEPARPTLQPVPAMPLPSGPAPEASADNVPGLEAATAEPEPGAAVAAGIPAVPGAPAVPATPTAPSAAEPAEAPAPPPRQPT